MQLRLSRVALLSAACVLGAVSAAGANTPENTYVASCGNYTPVLAPTSWHPSCRGGSMMIEDLQWTGWGSTETRATGTINLNTCEPSCAEGTFYPYPLEIAASGLRRCTWTEGRPWEYSSVRWAYSLPEDNPMDHEPGPHEDRYGTGSDYHCVRSSRQAAHVARGAMDMALLTEVGDVTSSGEEVRAGKCRRLRGKDVVLCRVAFGIPPYVQWKGRARLRISPRQVAFRITGRHKVCAHGCDSRRFNWTDRFAGGPFGPVSTPASRPAPRWAGVGSARRCRGTVYYGTSAIEVTRARRVACGRARRLARAAVAYRVSAGFPDAFCRRGFCWRFGEAKGNEPGLSRIDFTGHRGERRIHATQSVS